MKTRINVKFAWLIYPLLMTGCGGNSGDNTDDNPTVSNQSCTENCSETIIGNNPVVVSLDSPLAASIPQGEIRVFEVPSGSEVSLISNVGEAELILFDEMADIDVNNLYGANNGSLCTSAWRSKEDNCTATTSDGDVYAVVDAFYADSSVSITATNDCSVSSINRWVYRNMQDYYLYADQVPVVDPSSYSDTTDLIRDIRFNELEEFSGISDAETSRRRIEEGINFGFGYGWNRDSTGQLRLTYVYDNSPFGRAGFKRGDIAVSMSGEPIDTIDNARFNELIGDIDNPRSVNWEFIKNDTGETKTATLQMAEYATNTVLSTATYTDARVEGRVAYIAFKNFLETSSDELDSAIERINASDVTDLVLDLRYNGGGRSRVGRRFASQIGGMQLAGQTHTQHRGNSTYARFNYEEEFLEALPELNLNRLLVLTTGSTASASERLINSLRPYMEVTTFGSRTKGKPFRSRSKTYCGKSLSAMESEGFNSSGVSVLGGLAADCYAEDDLSRDYASDSGSIEGMLDTAMDYAFFNTCRSQPLTKINSQDSALKDHVLPTPVLTTYEQQLYGDDF